jgi:hypothetical protein
MFWHCINYCVIFFFARTKESLFKMSFIVFIIRLDRNQHWDGGTWSLILRTGNCRPEVVQNLWSRGYMNIITNLFYIAAQDIESLVELIYLWCCKTLYIYMRAWEWILRLWATCWSNAESFLCFLSESIRCNIKSILNSLETCRLLFVPSVICLKT